MDDIEAPIDMDRTFPNTIFISGLPKVGKEKFDKLNGVVGKSVEKFGKCERHMPMNEETGQTEGCVIVSYDNAECANKAQEALDGLALDKKHTFKVIKMDKFDQIMSRSEEF